MCRARRLRACRNGDCLGISALFRPAAPSKKPIFNRRQIRGAMGLASRGPIPQPKASKLPTFKRSRAVSDMSLERACYDKRRKLIDNGRSAPLNYRNRELTRLPIGRRLRLTISPLQNVNKGLSSENQFKFDIHSPPALEE
jgi:hypothetical protein